jgi:hypothetical protein
MSQPSDPVDRALQSLGGLQWSQDAGNVELERMLMQSFGTHARPSFYARHRTLVPAVAVLAMAVAGFAAVGGVSLVRSWFATVSVNGNVVHTGDVVPDENGQATITLPEGSLPPGENQISVTLEGDAAANGGTTTVTVNGQDGQVTIQKEPAADAGAEKK